MEIDEIDAKILRALLKDARTNFTDIAKDCNLSTTSIVKRFYKLKLNGVIQGTSLRLNLKDFGYNYRLSIDINTEGVNETDFLKMCKKIPNSIACYQVVGKYDFHLVINIRNIEEIEQIRHELKKQKGVKNIALTASYEAGTFPENLLIQPTKVVKNG